MKLKEKLAEDYAREMCGDLLKDEPVLNKYIPQYMKDAFKYGFDKGRDMTVVLWRKGEETAYVDFMNLGEEEVK